jgi:hypothetical protein
MNLVGGRARPDLSPVGSHRDDARGIAAPGVDGLPPAPGRRWRSRRRHEAAVSAVLLAWLIVLGAVPVAENSVAAAASAPRVAIIVGPAGDQTAGNRKWAKAAADEARRHTPNVVRVTSPNATWSSVKAAMTGAAVVVYIGRGLGYPEPGASSRRPAVHGGFALNPVAGVNDTKKRWYGESYMRTVDLAPRAVVLLHRADYAPGKGRPGAAEPSRSTARRRADNYAAGFLSAGASAVIAEYGMSPVYYIRSIFTRNTTIDRVWRGAPTLNRHVTSVASVRTAGAAVRLDPTRARSGYTRSLVGWPGTQTSRVRQEPAACAGTLQAKVDAAASGAVLDLTGCTYASGALIQKPLTVVGARVNVPTNQRGFIIMASNVTIDGVVITGPQASTYAWNEVGVLTSGTVSNVVVRNSTIRRFGNAGVWVGPSTNPRVTGNTIEDTVYAGVMIISAAGGRVDRNVIRRVGVKGSETKGGNAYGIAVSNEGGALSTDVVVDGNVVETVPTWHGLDTHAGVRITFSNNTVSGSPRAMFVTSDGSGRRPSDVRITGNRFLKPVLVSDRKAVTTYAADGVTVTGNTSTGWGAGNFFHDYLGRSTGLVVSGNTISP